MSLHIVKKNGGAYIDSQEVSACTGKNHGSVLDEIKETSEILGKLTEHFTVKDFFVECSYTSSAGYILPCYLLTKRDCELYAAKLSGENRPPPCGCEKNGN